MTATLTRQDRDTIAWLLRTARQQGWVRQSRPTQREPHRRHRWSRKGAEVTLAHSNHLSIWVSVEPGRTYDTEYTGEASTVAEFVRALVGTALLSGDVSVRQADDYELPTPIVYRQAGVSSVGLADPCARCRKPALLWVEFTHRPRVCSCSRQTRPTGAEPCRETTVTIACLGCAPFLDPSLRREVADR